MSPPNESTDSELLIRIDERVNHLCEQVDKVVKEQSKLQERSNQNQQNIDQLEDDISYNRKIYIGGLMLTVLTFLIARVIMGF